MRKKTTTKETKADHQPSLKMYMKLGLFSFASSKFFCSSVFVLILQQNSKLLTHFFKSFPLFHTLLHVFLVCAVRAPVQLLSAFGFHLLSPPSKTKWRTTSNLLYYIWILFCYTFPTMYCYVFHPCHAYTLYNLCSTTYT